MKTESTGVILRRIARGMTILVLTLILLLDSPWATTSDTVAMGSEVPFSPISAPAAAVSSDLSQRYIVFLDGINSYSSEESPLNDDFDFIQTFLHDRLETDRFVYFSYSAMNHALGQVPRYCQGWGKDNCSDELDLIDLLDSPVYTEDDTHQSIVEQANALIWLIDQIVKQDESAQIDLVGFSLGGIVVSYWASYAGNTSTHRDHIHSIVLIESPVGGIPLAELALGGCGLDPRCAIARWLLNSIYGSTVLSELQLPQLPGSLVGSLPQAARNFPVTSIQSTADYTVNRRTIPLCRNLACTASDDVPVGNGSQLWPPHTLHDSQQLSQRGLATRPISDLAAKDLIRDNHNAPLTHPQTAQWVFKAITEGSDILDPFITDLPEFPVVDPQAETEITFSMQNISGETWEAGDYSLVNIGGQNLSPWSQIAMDVDVPPGHSVQWRIPVTAPANLGIYRIAWQFSYKGVLGGPLIWTDLIVVPPGSSGEFRATIQRLIDQARQSAREEFEEEWAKIRQQIIELIKAEINRIIREAINEICPCGGTVVGLPLLLAALLSGHRRRSNGSEVPDDNE